MLSDRLRQYGRKECRFMLKIFLSSHGRFASGIRSSCEILLGAQQNLTVFDAYVDNDTVQEHLDDFYKTVSAEDQVLLCSDLYGGSVNQSMYPYDKMTALYSAYDNTTALISLLQMVYHNVKHYFQTQIDMQDVNQVLAAHFNDFGQKVVEAYIRPLKIKDSVPKYRVPIQSVLRRWEEDDTLLMAMANEALRDKRGKTLEDCRADLLRKIFWIEERYDNLEKDYLEEIDTQVRRYTRAATQKIENLTNRDQSVRGNLNVLLTALSRNRRAAELVDQIQPAFQLYEQSFLSEKSLWYRKRPEKRTKTASVLIQDDQAPNTEEQVRAAQLLQSKYGRAAVNAYVQGWLGDADIRCSEELSLEEDKDYIMSLLAILGSKDASAGYVVQELDGIFCKNGYSIPQIQIRRKEKKP